MSEKPIRCPYCGTMGIYYPSQKYDYSLVECPNCGRYKCHLEISLIGEKEQDKVAAYLYYSSIGKEHKFFNFLGSKNVFEKDVEEGYKCTFVTLAEINAFYPKTLAERIDCILLGMANQSQFLGDQIKYSRGQLISALFVRRFDNEGNPLKEDVVEHQLHEIVNFLCENKYIECIDEGETCSIGIKPEGYRRIDELQKDAAKNTKEVFVAMSFDKTLDNAYEAIKSAIEENGYISRRMDKIEHNNQIVPEMLYEIRKARFVVADLTGHNNGAYFEAGYALGNGKDVILTCQNDQFKDKAHFDVKQINTILWETPEDLKEKLFKRIEATIN